jgi:hypothetical protein
MGECLLRFQSPTNAAAELATKGPPWQTTSPASDDAGCAGGAGRRESKSIGEA